MAQSEFPNKVLDRRVSERYVRRGTITEKDLERLLKALPDLEDQKDVVSAELNTVLGIGPTQ